jgi:hypothetical protein
MRTTITKTLIRFYWTSAHMKAIKIICTISSFKPNKESNLRVGIFSLNKRYYDSLKEIPIDRNYY